MQLSPTPAPAGEFPVTAIALALDTAIRSAVATYQEPGRRRRGRPRKVAPVPVRVGALASAEARIERRDRAREAERRLIDKIQGRLCRDRQTALDRAFLKGQLDRRELFAGERMQSLWRRSGLQPRVTATLGRDMGGTSGTGQFGIERLTSERLDAYATWKDHMAYLTVPMREQVVRVCGLDEDASDPKALKEGLGRIAVLEG